MVNFIKVGISVAVCCIIAYMLFNSAMSVYKGFNHKDNIIVVQNSYTDVQNNNDNGLKYTDINVKPNGYSESSQIKQPTITPTVIISPTIKPTIKPTVINKPTQVITPKPFVSVNIPQEKVTFIKNSNDASKLHNCFNSVDTHDNYLIISPNTWNFGSSYYYLGDTMVVSGDFTNNYNKEIKNPLVRVTGFYNIAGQWIAGKEFDLHPNLNIKPGEKQTSYLEYNINGVPPGYYRLQADFIVDNKILLTMYKEVDILN